MDHKHQSSQPSYGESKVPSASVSKVVRSGNVNVRERSTFGGTSWKPKKLELDAESLTIINLTSQKRTRIALRDITELERTDLTDYSLGLKAKDKRFNFSFSSDPELYDWQDDMYRRCPLGNYSSPYDFVHKSHIGSDTVTGTFTDPNILPIYAEIIGGQPSISKTSPAVVVAPRSRPASGVPLAAVSKGIPSSGSTLLEGVFVIKEAGLFAGWLWKERWLTLMPQALIIHRRNTKTSASIKNISLPSLTRIELDEKREKCLLVEFATNHSSPSSSAPVPTNTVSIIFRSDTDLYTWRDALYLRSALSSPIGQPTNFVHHVHVGFDPATGGFTGLPAEWQALMNLSSSLGDKKARRQSRRKSVPLVPPTAA